MALVFPPRLLRFTSIAWQIRQTSRSGGSSVLGPEQIVDGPSGRWFASMTLAIGAMSWNGSEELLLYRGFMARLRGRAGVVALPYFDGRGPGQLLGLPETVPYDDGTLFSDGSGYGQPGIRVTLLGGALMNATELTLRYPAGVRPYPGQAVTLPGGWLHQIADLTARDGDDWTVLVSPWLRADQLAGAVIEVDRPTSRMRPVADDGGLLQIQAAQAWANPSLEFVEAL